ncbi:MAG: pantoate--beta-alanine ligase [Pirellula sp.]|nr:pantoate--beta-alanine ligase [Pirellula sp.]
MQVITGVAAMRTAVRALQQRGETVGFVPTMGALHVGHLSLVDAAAAECDRVVASIFVNPTQFGPSEDFTKYPRPLERDLELLRERGCDLVFVPEAAEMYPQGYGTSIDVGPVAVPWEGAARPGHFAGVATVVLKLFECVPADRAYFGRKDYQQTLVVRRMAADLNLPIDVRVCPIVRDADGLALSSRNVYLSPDERRRALALSQSLRLAEEIISRGERDALVVRERMLALIAAVGGVAVEYVAIVRDGTVDEAPEIDGPVTIAVAARVGTTRLIDNVQIG